MTDPRNQPQEDGPLNPALKSTTDTTYDTDRSTPAPIDTASATAGEGEGWPIIWLIVTAICVVAALVFLI